MTIEEVITEEAKKRIEDAIHMAELGTSCELRVHLENKCKEEVLDRASYIFAQLDMHETELRNGVLIYMALEDRKMAIIGDAGIHQYVNNEGWSGVKEEMIQLLREDKIEAGLIHGIQRVGEKIKQYFPISENDRNELPNELTMGGYKAKHKKG